MAGLKLGIEPADTTIVFAAYPVAVGHTANGVAIDSDGLRLGRAEGHGMDKTGNCQKNLAHRVVPPDEGEVCSVAFG